MIEIINQQLRYWISLKKFKDLLEKLVEHRKLKDPEVTLVFVDTKTIKRLNNKFLKRNAPTDVLSFPLGEKSADGKLFLTKTRPGKRAGAFNRPWLSSSYRI